MKYLKLNFSSHPAKPRFGLIFSSKGKKKEGVKKKITKKTGNGANSAVKLE